MGRLDAASLFSEKIRPCFQTGIEHGRHHGRVVDPPFSDSERIRPWPPSGFGYMRPLSLRKDQTMFSDRNRPWTPSRSGRGSSVPRLRADQAIDAIMVWLDALSLFSEKIRPCSQTGIDHGRHRSRVVDPPFSDSERIRSWTPSWFGWILCHCFPKKISHVLRPE